MKAGKRILVFDTACQSGRNSSGKGVEVTELSNEMDRSGILKALVRERNFCQTVSNRISRKLKPQPK